MKKFICLFLAILMLGTAVPVSAIADSQENRSNSSEQNEIVLESSGNYTLALKAEDFENGDACFYLVENGTVIYKSYVHRDTNKITDTDYSGTAPITRTQYVEPISKVNVPATYGYTYAGRIGYDQYSQGTVMSRNYLDVSYSSNYNATSAYNIGGEYRNAAGLASYIATLLGIPGLIAGVAAGTVITVLGLITGAGSIFIDDYYLSAEETKITWSATNPYNSSMSGKIAGSRYVITHEGHNKNDVKTDGKYFPVTSYSTHNTSLACTLYELVFIAFDTYEVVSWT